MSEADEHPVNDPIERLIDAWCERRDLKPLALLLPAFLANNGLTDGWADVMEALRDLRSRGGLPSEEQAVVDQLLPLVEGMVSRA